MKKNPNGWPPGIPSDLPGFEILEGLTLDTGPRKYQYVVPTGLRESCVRSIATDISSLRDSGIPLKMHMVDYWEKNIPQRGKPSPGGTKYG